MGLKKKITRALKMREMKLLERLVPYLSDAQFHEIVEESIESLEKHVGNILYVSEEYFKYNYPFGFESSLLTYYLTDLYFHNLHFPNSWRVVFLDIAIKSVDLSYSNYVDVFSDSKCTTRDVFMEHVGTYDNIMNEKYTPRNVWTSFRFSDTPSSKLFDALGNYIYYTVFSGSILVGNPANISELYISDTESRNFFALMIVITEIINDHMNSISKTIKAKARKA